MQWEINYCRELWVVQVPRYHDCEGLRKRDRHTSLFLHFPESAFSSREGGGYRKVTDKEEEEEEEEEESESCFSFFFALFRPPPFLSLCPPIAEPYYYCFAYYRLSIFGQICTRLFSPHTLYVLLYPPEGWVAGKYDLSSSRVFFLRLTCPVRT